MKELKVEALFGQQAKNAHETETRMAELNDKAACLISFDPFVLGQDTATSAQTFVGVEELNGLFQKSFSTVNPTAVFEAINDPYSFIVTTIRRGLPIFCLRRSPEFQQNYMDWIKAGEMPCIWRMNLPSPEI